MIRKMLRIAEKAFRRLGALDRDGDRARERGGNGGRRLIWFPQSLTKSLCALGALCLMSPSHPSFATVNSALTAKVHANSPQTCDISVVEIGPEVGGVFQPQLALLYDTRQGLARVRRVYGYFARPNSSQPAEVLNVDGVDRNIGLYLAYQIGKGIIASGVVTIGITTAGDRFGVQPYLTNSKVQVRKAIETVRSYTESPTFAVPDGLNVNIQDFRDETKRLLLAGENILQFRKLFVDRTLAPKAWDWSAQTLRANADHNDTRLSFVLERVGQRGLRRVHWGDHFATLQWHRDELLEVASLLDFVHLDVDSHGMPDRPLTDEEKEGFRRVLNHMFADADTDGYVTIAIYDLMNSNKDKVKVFDGVSGPRNLAGRKYVQLLRSIGLDFGGALLSLGPKVLMNVVDGGINLLFDKRGVMILYEHLEESEAELFASLNNGLWGVTADTREGELFASLNSSLRGVPAGTRERLRIEGAIDRQNINAFTGLEGDASANRLANATRMTSYLKEHSQQMCDEVNKVRGNDFRSDYLTWGERMGAGLKHLVGWLPGVPHLDGPLQQAALIQERLPAVEARRTLRLYDPEKYGSPKAPDVGAALTTLAVKHDRQDVTILGQVLQRTGEEGLMASVLRAMAVHGDAELSDSIVEWLGTIQPGSRYGTTSIVSTALQTLNALNWPDVRHTGTQLVAVQDAVAPFAERGVGENKELAARVLANVQEQLTYWRSQYRKDIQSP